MSGQRPQSDCDSNRSSFRLYSVEVSSGFEVTCLRTEARCSACMPGETDAAAGPLTTLPRPLQCRQTADGHSDAETLVSAGDKTRELVLFTCALSEAMLDVPVRTSNSLASRCATGTEATGLSCDVTRCMLRLPGDALILQFGCRCCVC